MLDSIGQQTVDCELWQFTMSGQSQLQDGQGRAEIGTRREKTSGSTESFQLPGK